MPVYENAIQFKVYIHGYKQNNGEVLLTKTAFSLVYVDKDTVGKVHDLLPRVFLKI